VQEQEEISQTRVSNQDIQRFVNIIELLDTSPLLKDLFLDMSGFDIVNIDGKTTLLRNRKPKWSDDFSYEIVGTIRKNANIVTSQTNISKEELDAYLYQRMSSLNASIFYTGRSNYITPLIWESIIINFKNNKVKNWRTKHISEALVESHREKQDYGDFNIQAKNLVLDLQGLLKASLYRSRDGLTLLHHQNVERITEKITQPKKKGFFGRLSNTGNVQNDIS